MSVRVGCHVYVVPKCVVYVVEVISMQILYKFITCILVIIYLIALSCWWLVLLHLVVNKGLQVAQLQLLLRVG